MVNQTQDTHTSSVPRTRDLKKNHTAYGKLDQYASKRVFRSRQCLCQETPRRKTSNGKGSLLAKAKTERQERPEGDSHTKENDARKYQARILTVFTLILVEPQGTIQEGVMHLEGLAKFERNKVFKEVPPVKDEKGEATEVQVLEEGDVYVGVFDPDEFLEKLEQFQPQCPRCQVPMTFGEVQQTNGNTWRYWRCPPKNWDAKCYVTFSASEVGDYLRRVEKQTHPCYNKINPARFRCECDLSLVLATSHSVNNAERLYLKCPARTCKFFQWIN